MYKFLNPYIYIGVGPDITRITTQFEARPYVFRPGSGGTNMTSLYKQGPKFFKIIIVYFSKNYYFLKFELKLKDLAN